MIQNIFRVIIFRAKKENKDFRWISCFGFKSISSKYGDYDCKNFNEYKDCNYKNELGNIDIEMNQPKIWNTKQRLGYVLRVLIHYDGKISINKIRLIF